MIWRETVDAFMHGLSPPGYGAKALWPVDVIASKRAFKAMKGTNLPRLKGRLALACCSDRDDISQD